MEPILIGIVGLGRFAQQHLQCLKQIPGVRIQAVCDIRQQVADQIAQELGCKGYSDLHEMLRNERLTVLDILVPEVLHHDAAMAGLAAGCHIFVEKPLEIEVEKAAEMVQKAADKQLILMVGHVTRFDPRYIEMKRQIEQGKLGRIRSIYAKRSDLKRFYSIYKRTPTIFVLGVHDIDQILWCMDELPVEVYAKSSSSEEGEDLVWSMLTFRNGTIAVIESNWLVPDAWPGTNDQLMLVNGDSGVLRMEAPDQAIRICTNEEVQWPSPFGLQEIHGQLQGPLMSELVHFMACVRDGVESRILPAGDALNVIRVADAIVRSCREGIPIRLGS
ncbi:Inositol 2-dehydrogenase [compost metagenome]